MKIDSKSDLNSSISELKSLGLEKTKLNELNDSYEIESFRWIIIVSITIVLLGQEYSQQALHVNLLTTVE